MKVEHVFHWDSWGVAKETAFLISRLLVSKRRPTLIDEIFEQLYTICLKKTLFLVAINPEPDINHKISKGRIFHSRCTAALFLQHLDISVFPTFTLCTNQTTSSTVIYRIPLIKAFVSSEPEPSTKANTHCASPCLNHP